MWRWMCRGGRQDAGLEVGGRVALRPFRGSCAALRPFWRSPQPRAQDRRKGDAEARGGGRLRVPEPAWNGEEAWQDGAGIDEERVKWCRKSLENGTGVTVDRVSAREVPRNGRRRPSERGTGGDRLRLNGLAGRETGAARSGPGLGLLADDEVAPQPDHACNRG